MISNNSWYALQVHETRMVSESPPIWSLLGAWSLERNASFSMMGFSKSRGSNLRIVVLMSFSDVVFSERLVSPKNIVLHEDR